jgi:hypothetical protein
MLKTTVVMLSNELTAGGVSFVWGRGGDMAVVAKMTCRSQHDLVINIPEMPLMFPAVKVLEAQVSMQAIWKPPGFSWKGGFPNRFIPIVSRYKG